jgi:chromatin modification-related protein VID21
MQRQTSLKKVKKGDKKESKDPKGSWTPMEFNRWQAILSHNPAHKMVRKSTKCLTSADWDVAIRELLVVKAFERVDEMKAKGEWSLRQPQRQKQPVIAKDHWAYLLDEMVSLPLVTDNQVFTTMIEMDARRLSRGTEVEDGSRSRIG